MKILTHLMDIDETLKVTQVQGQNIKDQGRICIYVETYLGLKLMNKWKDLLETLMVSYAQGQVYFPDLLCKRAAFAYKSC